MWPMLQANQKRFARAAAKLESNFGRQVLEKEQLDLSIVSFLTWKPDLPRQPSQLKTVLNCLKWSQGLYSDCRLRAAGLGMSVAFLTRLLTLGGPPGDRNDERAVWTAHFDRWVVVSSIEEKLRADSSLASILDISKKIEEINEAAKWLSQALRSTDASLDHHVYLTVADGVLEDLLVHLRWRENNYFKWMGIVTPRETPVPGAPGPTLGPGSSSDAAGGTETGDYFI